MSNVIELLEGIGRDAHLRHATHTEIEQVLVRAGIAPALRAAILAADQSLLEALLGAKSNVCCMIHSPDQERKDDKTREVPIEKPEKPDKPAESRSHALAHVA